MAIYKNKKCKFFRGFEYISVDFMSLINMYKIDVKCKHMFGIDKIFENNIE